MKFSQKGCSNLKYIKMAEQATILALFKCRRFGELTIGCVCKLMNPHYYSLDGLYICMAHGLVFTDFHTMLNHIQNMYIILLNSENNFILYLYNFL